MKKKVTGHFFIILLWLIYRLGLGIELSRLAIFRFKPHAVVSFVRHTHNQFPHGVWIDENESLFWIGMDARATTVHLKETVLESN